MSQAGEARGIEALQRRVERALADGAGRKQLEPMLQRLVRMAPDGHAAKLFAQRHLAELILERDPWSAALHLRKVLVAEPRDAVAQSLMALAQALLGNYRAAIAAYRNAIEVDPRNPWYHHNLGHLLDVAMDDPHAAWHHFERALDGPQPIEDEIIASAAHCSARLGDMEVALEMAREALAAAPHNENHQHLLAWIERGAPADESADAAPKTPAKRSPKKDAGPSKRDLQRESLSAAIAALLRERMVAAGLPEEAIVSGELLWQDYAKSAPPQGRKPETYAAAIHYAVLRSRSSAATQKDIADLYGVSAGSVGTRFRHVLETVTRGL